MNVRPLRRRAGGTCCRVGVRRVHAHPHKGRDGRLAERDGVAHRGRRPPRRRHGHRRRRRHGVRAGGDAPDGRQHRRRRLHRVPPERRRAGRVRLSRDGPCEGQRHDVSQGRQRTARTSITTATWRSACPALSLVCISRGRSTASCRGSASWTRQSALARDGFVVTDGLSRSLKGVLPRMKDFPASIAQFTRQGVPYEAGDLLKLPDLARTLERIAGTARRGSTRARRRCSSRRTWQRTAA